METRQTKKKKKKYYQQTMDHSRVSADCDILPFPYFRQIAYASPLRMREDLSERGLFPHIRTVLCAPVKAFCKIQALVYDILPSTTAVFSYAIGSRKLLANEQFFVGTQTVASLLQKTQIKQGVSFIAANKVYTSTNKTTIV